LTPFKTPNQKAAEVLNLLPEVRWDRCVRRMEWLAAYGWIDREDGRSDFVVVYVDHNGPVGYATSSAALSKTFSDRLFGSRVDHRDCERIEDVFGDLVKCKVTLNSEQPKPQQ